MSRSYRTTKESILANRRMKCDITGRPVLPRVILRKPHAGDIHPLGKSLILRTFQQIPEKYLYGLSKIELRPRVGKIGRPFGLYIRSDKAIYLYSIPVVWQLSSLSDAAETSLKSYYVDIEHCENEVTVRWPNESILSFWFFFEVLTHELGHHFRNQYKSKRKYPARKIDEELVADLHGNRIKEIIISFLRKRIDERQDCNKSSSY